MPSRPGNSDAWTHVPTSLSLRSLGQPDSGNLHLVTVTSSKPASHMSRGNWCVTVTERPILSQASRIKRDHFAMGESSLTVPSSHKMGYTLSWISK
ncbi:hypothetical protein CH063_05972 [Colletotrichum higginsianum]|uniref:Uncharacterized protein n=1 Tax=Colletotrichum higginsianum (strain IMI 349063) TaxID=759273 RepID=H1V0X4_COLHI|nr:hypothetical protein CH063_05972 [Colletotrichum higginsianum]